MIKKLKIKFIAINMTIVTILLFMILGTVYYFTSAGIENQSIRMMQRIAYTPFAAQTPSEYEEDVRLPFFVVRLNYEGEKISAGGSYYDLSNEEVIDRLLNKVINNPKRVGVLKNYNLRYCKVDFPGSSAIVFADISGEKKTLEGLLRNCIIIGTLGFFIFLSFSYVLSNRAVKPLEKSLKRQREFIEDASHELKTPLTVIMTNAQLLEENENGEFASKASKNILTMSRQMKALIEKMLLLAKADGSSFKLSLKKENLSKILENAIFPFEPLFFEKGLMLDYDIEKDIFVMGDKNELREVLEIFLDNARKYCFKNSKISVSLKRKGKNKALLKVSNEGEALSKETLENMFDRFYRADKSRKSDGSFGLGLSIAYTIAENHKAKIYAESENNINTLFFEIGILKG